MKTIAKARPTRSSPPPSRTPPLHRITVDEFERIVASGALEDPSRVELVDGCMVDKTAKNPGHSFSTIATDQALADRLPAGWSSWMEQPVRIPDFDGPEPDISVARGTNACQTLRPIDVDDLLP